MNLAHIIVYVLGMFYICLYLQRSK